MLKFGSVVLALLLVGLLAHAEPSAEPRFRVQIRDGNTRMPEAVLAHDQGMKMQIGTHFLSLHLLRIDGEYELQQLDRAGEVVATARFPAEQASSRVRLGSWQVRIERLRPAEVTELERQAQHAQGAYLRALRRAKNAQPLPTSDSKRRRIELVAKAELFKIERGITLPQTLVFDAEQRAIAVFHQFVDLPTLLAKIEQARQQPQDLDLSLAQALHYYRERDTGPVAQLPARELYILQAWADWCAPCIQETRALEAHFAAHPDLPWLWLHAETDFAKHARR